MPRIISFAYTTPALLAGAKTVTRRGWYDDYARRFKLGDIIHAYDRSPRHHGNHVATIRIVSCTKKPDAETSHSDYEDEGLEWLTEHPESLPKGNRIAYLDGCSREFFEDWRRSGGSIWLVPFEVVP